MGQPGMQAAGAQRAAPLGDQGSQNVTPQDQAKGAIEVLSKLRQSNMDQIEAVATQFPAISKAAKDLFGAFDRAVQALIREIINTTRTAEPTTPRVAR